MEKLNIFSLILGAGLFLQSCEKEVNSQYDSLSPQEKLALENMEWAYNEMCGNIDSLQFASSMQQQYHFERLFHRNDSLYWYHHSQYSHGHNFDDHHHNQGMENQHGGHMRQNHRTMTPGGGGHFHSGMNDHGQGMHLHGNYCHDQVDSLYQVHSDLHP